MLRTVKQALARAGVAPDELVVVGCSHGPDSLALADALVALRQPVHIIYVDHGLRSAAADEGRAVLEFAAAAGAPARVVPVLVAGGHGPEDAARRARHAALEAVADELGARWIALGHTASDQAETVVMRLLRGAGPLGLAAIAERRGRVVRPLLALTRADVDAYLAGRGLSPSQDDSNASDRFLRNRVRHVVLPALAVENPRIVATLARTASAMREAADGLEWAADQALPGLRRGAGLDAAGLTALPPAIAKRVLSRLVDGLEARHLEDLLALAAGSTGSRSIDLPGATAWREYDALVISPPAQDTVEVTVTGPGGPYHTRRFTAGDRMRPASLKGHSRKLQDLFTDRKVPRRLRADAVVVVRIADGEIVWAEHIGPAITLGPGVRVALTRRGTAVSF